MVELETSNQELSFRQVVAERWRRIGVWGAARDVLGAISIASFAAYTEIGIAPSRISEGALLVASGSFALASSTLLVEAIDSPDSTTSSELYNAVIARCIDGVTNFADRIS